PPRLPPDFSASACSGADARRLSLPWPSSLFRPLEILKPNDPTRLVFFTAGDIDRLHELVQQCWCLRPGRPEELIGARLHVALDGVGQGLTFLRISGADDSLNGVKKLVHPDILFACCHFRTPVVRDGALVLCSNHVTNIVSNGGQICSVDVS